jgi:hypothetical protein
MASELENKIIEVLTIWGQDLVNDTKAEIDKIITHAGGQTSDLSGSVNYKVLNRNGVINFQLTMNDYWVNVEEGRKPNSTPPPLKPIKDWINKKHLPVDQILLAVNIKHRGQGKSLGGLKITKRTLKTISHEKKVERVSWLFAKSIGKKGIKPKPFIDKVLTDDRMNKLKQMLAPVIKQQFILEIKKELQ